MYNGRMFITEILSTYIQEGLPLADTVQLTLKVLLLDLNGVNHGFSAFTVHIPINARQHQAHKLIEDEALVAVQNEGVNNPELFIYITFGRQ